jgi:hypothetical protein
MVGRLRLPLECPVRAFHALDASTRRPRHLARTANSGWLPIPSPRCGSARSRQAPSCWERCRRDHVGGPSAGWPGRRGCCRSGWRSNPRCSRTVRPGRVDHHGLIFLTTAVLFGFSVRLAIEPRSARASAAAGIAAALGIWVSTELLLPVALFLMAFLVAWIVSGAPSASVMRTFALWWAGGTVVALVIERAPGHARLAGPRQDLGGASAGGWPGRHVLGAGRIRETIGGRRGRSWRRGRD